MFFFNLSERFDVYVFLISETFTTRIIFLCHELPLYFPFPLQKLVSKYLLKGGKYPTMRIIIYGTEIYLIVLEIKCGCQYIATQGVHCSVPFSIPVSVQLLCLYRSTPNQVRQPRSVCFNIFISAFQSVPALYCPPHLVDKYRSRRARILSSHVSVSFLITSTLPVCISAKLAHFFLINVLNIYLFYF